MQLRATKKTVGQDIRAANRRLVLQSLFRSAGLSRADLARLTGLNPATVSNLTASLLEEGIVEELGRGPAKVGKPSTLLRLNPYSRSIVSVDLSNSSALRAAVLDLEGNSVHRVHRELPAVVGERAVAVTVEVIAEAISAAPMPVLGIGVGTPGVVTPTGTVVQASNLGWLDLDLAGLLRERFGLPATVSNDANAAALAEYSYAESDTHNLMVIRVSSGVGAGLIVSGQPYFGESFAAGEIGHIVVEDGGLLCRCGNRGCLETYMSIAPLQMETAAAGDNPAEVAGRHLGRVLAGVVGLLDIREIIVAETGLSFQDELCCAALSSLREHTLPRLGQSVDLRMSKLGEDIVLLGAGMLVLFNEMGVV